MVPEDRVVGVADYLGIRLRNLRRAVRGDTKRSRHGMFGREAMEKQIKRKRNQLLSERTQDRQA